MAHTANWKAAAIPPNQPLPWLIIDLTWWPWFKSPVVPKTSGASLKPDKSDQTVRVSFQNSVGSSLYVTVGFSILSSVHNSLLSAHLNDPTYTEWLPACFRLPNWSGKAPQVETDTNQEQVWLQISTMSSCRGSCRCPFLSWLRGLNVSH